MLEHTPALSIIVPVYKVEKYLSACIDSILAQTFRDFELILVDDGSPDGCPALCDAAARRDDRIRVLHQQNGGLSAARNAGLDIARGQWIGFVDSDDTIAPAMYEKLYTAATQENAQIAVCNFRLVDEQGNGLKKDWAELGKIAEKTLLSGKDALRRAGVAAMHTAWNKLYHRTLWQNHRFPVGKQNEDLFTLPLLYEECARVVCIPEMLYNYLQRNDSIMGSRVGLKNYDQAEAAGTYWECLRRNGLQQELPKAASQVWVKTMEVYCHLAPEEQQTPRSTQMRMLQYEIVKKTAGVCSVPMQIWLRSVLLRFAPQVYTTSRKLKNRMKR